METFMQVVGKKKLMIFPVTADAAARMPPAAAAAVVEKNDLQIVFCFLKKNNLTFLNIKLN